MNTKPTVRRRFPVLALSLIVAGAASSIVGSMPVEAATIPDPVTNITVTPADPRLSDSVRTDVTWCVPDATAAGDTFTIALPAQLVALPRGFPLRDPAGLLVANATIAGTPAIATFTFTDYVDTHVNVCGTAFFESRLDSSLTPGTTYTLTYVVNGVTTFEPTVTIRPGDTTTGRPTARKGGYFGDTTDECRTDATGCLGWYLESQLGPFSSITITDDGLAGATFECASLSVRIWSVDASGNLLNSFAPATVGVTVTTDCSPTSLQVVATNIPANRLLRVLIRATPQTIDPAGGVLFQNAALVTHVFPNQTVDTDNVAGQRRSARVGGDANGVQPPPPATTVPAPTTVAGQTPSAPTTSVVAALPPVPPTFPVPPNAQLPATGSSSNSSLFFAGICMLIAGASLLVAARRRGLHADVG
jgi:LPXTG-motif cell wall-anchored protein